AVRCPFQGGGVHCKYTTTEKRSLMAKPLPPLVALRSPVVWLAAAVAVLGCAASSPPDASVGALVTPAVFEGDLRRLPTAKTWKPGDPVRVIEQKESGPGETGTPSTTQGPNVGPAVPPAGGAESPGGVGSD